RRGGVAEFHGLAALDSDGDRVSVLGLPRQDDLVAFVHEIGRGGKREDARGCGGLVFVAAAATRCEGGAHDRPNQRYASEHSSHLRASSQGERARCSRKRRRGEVPLCTWLRKM